MIKWPKIDLKASNEASYTCAFTGQPQSLTLWWSSISTNV